MKCRALFFLLTLQACILGVSAQSIALGEVAAALENAKPGDRIVIQNNTYTDMDLRWKGVGREGRPITIAAETPGGVVIEGTSSLKFAGEWLQIEGLHFRNGDPGKNSAVIEFRLGGDVANHCRMTECAVDRFTPASRATAYSYVRLYGRHNRFDHNVLTGHSNLGVTLIVMLDEERSRQNHHRIDHNYFGNRPVYGSNGAETIRIGTSHQAYESANTVVEENIFERCDGEVEVVSIKSSDNIIRRNIFWESQGVLALRHGDRNIAEENIFVGNGVRNTGGIRVVNAGHRIRRNVFHGLTGTRFFAPLALMNAVPNSLPNRYCLVEDVEVTGNTFMNCSPIEFGTGRDAERTLPPERVTFADNRIVNLSADKPFVEVDAISGFTFRNNEVMLAQKTEMQGFRNIEMLAAVLPIPTHAEALAGKGASWFALTEEFAEERPVGAIRRVTDGGELLRAVDQARDGDKILLQGETFFIDRAITVKKQLTIVGEASNGRRPEIRFAGSKSDNMLTIADGGQLSISGVAFCGLIADGCAGPRSGISSADVMIDPYTLEVDNCSFYDFGESDAFAVRGTKNTFAERIVIRNSLFHGLSGDAVNYAAERDDKGRYNADEVVIENCTFYRLLGLGINIYRGGSDESTAGPYVYIRRCNFEDVCNKERGSVMRLVGPQIMEITGCNFSNSGRGGVSVRLDETSWEKIAIRDCNLWNAGRILSMTGNAVQGGLTNLEPQYRNAETLDFRIVDSNPLHELGIGLE